MCLAADKCKASRTALEPGRPPAIRRRCERCAISPFVTQDAIPFAIEGTRRVERMPAGELWSMKETAQARDHAPAHHARSDLSGENRLLVRSSMIQARPSPACNFCVENLVIPANVSRSHRMRALGTPPLVGDEATSVRVRRQRGRGRICRTRGLSGARMNDGPVTGRNYLPPQPRAWQRPHYSSL
jgi:hypothetical protein